jgi:hypothetical protein
MTTEQQDYMDNQRRVTLNPPSPANGMVEIVRKTSDGYDVRTSETFYKIERLGVYSSRQAALEAAFKKYCPDLSIEPLKVDG